MPDEDTDAFGNPDIAPPAYPQASAQPAPSAPSGPSGPEAPVAPSTAGPGWYPDPRGGTERRWWDGQQWHGLTGTPGAAGGASGSGGQTDGFAIAALVFAVIGGVILSVVFAFVSLSRIKKGKRQNGRGMAIAALWISLAWVVVGGGLIVLAATGVLDSKNVDNYSGPQRDVARVIDRFEDEADDSPSATCALMTQEFQATLAASKGSCEKAVGHEDGVQADIDAKSITMIGGGRATAVVEEDGDRLRMNFKLVDGQWKIDDIIVRP